MSSIVWLHHKDSLHTYGLEIMSADKYTVENFVYNQIPTLCRKLECKYFIQGFQLNEYRNSWAFIEFLGEGNYDTILNLMIEFNKLFGCAYHTGEIMMEEPSRELLTELGLLCWRIL